MYRLTHNIQHPFQNLKTLPTPTGILPFSPHRKDHIPRKFDSLPIWVESFTSFRPSIVNFIAMTLAWITIIIEWLCADAERVRGLITGDAHVYGWFSENFNFCCTICLNFEIWNFRIYPVYTSSFMCIFSDLKTDNAKFETFTSFLHRFCTNLSMKFLKNKLIKLIAYKDSEKVTIVIVRGSFRN